MRPQDKDFPEVDLDALEAKQAREERTENAEIAPDRHRPMTLRLPVGGELPLSQKWLDRLYQGQRVVAEKKPCVFDHLRSVGPWMVSVDDTPLAVLDGMSQTATLPGGFAPDPVVRHYMEGGFGPTILRNDDTSHGAHPAARAYAETLQQRLPGFAHVTFTNSGAEANEKALALARCNAPAGANRLLAFEGSFHGRTLLALHATYNPVKRGPFEVPGYEVTFAPFPAWFDPDEEPDDPAGFLDAATEGRLDGYAADESDTLFAREIECLRAVDAALSSREYFACIAEPMQSEGGDRYATGRFFRALRLVTRRQGVPLIFDEVQTGFGLGGTFAWHTRFDLVDPRGNADVPDAVVFAKRAQVGVVMSKWIDTEPTSSHTASLVRGRLHADMIDAEHAHDLEQKVRRRLGVVASTFPRLVAQPRARGYAFAFDLPSPETLERYIAQRFYRGAVVFGAGDRTIRYRLSSTWTERDLDILFRAVHDTLEWLDENPDEDPPPWEAARRQTLRSIPTWRVRQVGPEDAEETIAAIIDMETRIYEPARREPLYRLETCFEDPHGVVLLAEVDTGDGDWDLAGFALGASLERFEEVPGPNRDSMRGRHNTLYSVTITVERHYQNMGLGRALKAKQVEVARGMTDDDDSRRYEFISGRNRVGYAGAMMTVNQRFGAYEINRLFGAYDEEGEALYYRLPLGPFVPEDDVHFEDAGNLSGGIARPFARPPKSLGRALSRGNLFGPVVNKITMCNYVSPAIVRGIEYVDALAPHHPHLYMTSCRDETVDKSMRIVRWHRKDATVAIGVEGGYVGHTTAAARSISDPATHRQGPVHFDWPRIPHPAVDAPGAESSLRAAITAAGGGERCLGLFVEPVQERTGRVIPDSFWQTLDGIRRETGVPVIAVETATACWRSGNGPFYGSGIDFVPDLLAWWAGGQLGFVQVTAPWFVDKPLTMISTWDGDELSLIRAHHQLRAGRKVDIGALAEALDEACAPLAAAGVRVEGAGAYRVIAAGNRAPDLQAALAERGLRLQRYPGGHLVLAPGLDTIRTDVDRVSRALREIL